MTLETIGFCADNSQTYVSIEREALQLRRVVSPSPKLDEKLMGIELFESLDGYEVPVGDRHVSLDFAVADLPNGPEALALYDKSRDVIVIALSETTYKNLERGHRRARFSLCHELGHAVLHPAQLMRFSRIPHRVAALRRGSWSSHPRYMDTEWQANAFAAALLMPAQGLAAMDRKYGSLSSGAISTHFQVSEECALRRLSTFSEKREMLLRVVG